MILPLVSCVKHRQLLSLNEGRAFPDSPVAIQHQTSISIQPGDLLAISVQTVDPAVSAPFNFGGIPTAGNEQKVETTGIQITSAQNTGGGLSYLVDANGEINMPMLGKVKLNGLTTLQSRDTLTRQLSKYLTSPIVNVRLLNFKITVLGEVGHSGSFPVENERINILQALGLAGDFTPYSNRERVLVIREIQGKREFAYLNLHNREVFDSPFFYLQPNDVVYVEAARYKVAATSDEATKYIQWALPIVSALSIIITLTR